MLSTPHNLRLLEDPSELGGIGQISLISLRFPVVSLKSTGFGLFLFHWLLFPLICLLNPTDFGQFLAFLHTYMHWRGGGGRVLGGVGVLG